jgi:hypothetical protein
MIFYCLDLTLIAPFINFGSKRSRVSMRRWIWDWKEDIVSKYLEAFPSKDVSTLSIGIHILTELMSFA